MIRSDDKICQVILDLDFFKEFRGEICARLRSELVVLIDHRAVGLLGVRSVLG